MGLGPDGEIAWLDVETDAGGGVEDDSEGEQGAAGTTN